MLPNPGDVPPLAEVLKTRRSELGLSQADLADAVARVYRPTVTANDVARWERGKRIPRVAPRRALEEVLLLPLLYLDRAATVQRTIRHEPANIGVVQKMANPGRQIRSALLEMSASSWSGAPDGSAPKLIEVEANLNQLMTDYQASRFGQVLERLPVVLTGANSCVLASSAAEKRRANRTLALSGQAAAMVLTKVGELDLAWMATERGRSAAEFTEDLAVIGSLDRSLVHTLQSHGQTDASAQLAERSADRLRGSLTGGRGEAASVYGTFLLASSMAAVRGGDESTAVEYLDEAQFYADQLGEDANHLWTAFGPTNVGVHRVASAVAADSIGHASNHARSVDASNLPSERHVRHLFDVAMIELRQDQIESAIATMLKAERIAPDQVYRHLMSQQIVAHLRSTKRGRQNPDLAQLDQRAQKIAALGS